MSMLVSEPSYVSLDESRAGEFLPKDPPGTLPGAPTVEPRVIRAYFGEVKEVVPGPQGFLVHNYPVRSTIRAHFHPVDQFQIFFPAPGAWYKNDPVDEIVLHYADANVTYGPLGTKDCTFSFFTLRPRATARTNYVPEDRDQLPPPPRPRHRNMHTAVPNGEVDAITPIFGRAEDGMSADLVRLEPGQTRTLTQDQPSSGRYYVVLDGGLVQGEREHGEWALAWVPADRPVDTVRATAAGCRFLVLQFPGTS